MSEITIYLQNAGSIFRRPTNQYCAKSHAFGKQCVMNTFLSAPLFHSLWSIIDAHSICDPVHAFSHSFSASSSASNVSPSAPAS